MALRQRLLDTLKRKRSSPALPPSGHLTVTVNNKVVLEPVTVDLEVRVAIAKCNQSGSGKK